MDWCSSRMSSTGPVERTGASSAANGPLALFPAIVILDPDDVVLAEIAAGLDLDQLQIDLAGIFEAVRRSDRDEDRFVLVDDLRLLPDDDPGGAADHDPVLGTMVMELQRKTPGRFHDDALDLI